MSQALLLHPDRSFAEELIACGGGDLKKCYQCATCSVVCELSNVGAPFPRKEMIWAQWGLKNRLVSDPDVWLCHQCNDCSTRCPRGARPGDVLAAVRQKSVEHHAVPNALARSVNQVKFYPLLLLLVPGVLLAAALVLRGTLERILPLGEPHESAFYADFFPHWLLIGFFSTFTALSFVGLVFGLVRFWRGMAAADRMDGKEPTIGVGASVVRTVKSVLLHDRFAKCTDRVSRRSSHLMAFYGFMALFVVTVWATIDLYLLPMLGVESLYPFNLLHPMKIVANIGGILLVMGCVKAIVDRSKSRESGGSSSFDWTFVWLLLLVGITGFVTEAFRFAVDPVQRTALEYAAYSIYFVHLILVFGLLVYLPYSKFAHIFYRTVAMIYAEHSGRTQGGERVELPAVVEKAS
ncbi:MAG: quinone-interacting membrane-bound oxidoreductase complex subunit QmoC [Gemmatimonadota bacterium]|nr:MAG: quinone-interacting membrane-bound oxidoreductase complex subunit QmoC [Gemmatimonadota bacterium]